MGGHLQHPVFSLQIFEALQAWLDLRDARNRVACAIVGMPLYQMFKFVGQPGRMRKVKKVRAAACFAALIAVIIAHPDDPHTPANFRDARAHSRQA